MSNIFASELFWRIAIPVIGWYLMPAFFNALYSHNIQLHRERMRRSVPITPGNAWMGLFVESWDGVPPSRGPYIFMGAVSKYVLITVWAWDWWWV